MSIGRKRIRQKTYKIYKAGQERTGQGRSREDKRESQGRHGQHLEPGDEDSYGCTGRF